MSEQRRTLRCLACNAIAWDNGGSVPEACPSCGARWREPAVAIVEPAGPYALPGGASILKQESPSAPTYAHGPYPPPRVEGRTIYLYCRLRSKSHAKGMTTYELEEVTGTASDIKLEFEDPDSKQFGEYPLDDIRCYKVEYPEGPEWDAALDRARRSGVTH